MKNFFIIVLSFCFISQVGISDNMSLIDRIQELIGTSNQQTHPPVDESYDQGNDWSESRLEAFCRKNLSKLGSLGKCLGIFFILETESDADLKIERSVTIDEKMMEFCANEIYLDDDQFICLSIIADNALLPCTLEIAIQIKNDKDALQFLEDMKEENNNDDDRRSFYAIVEDLRMSHIDLSVCESNE